MGLPMVGLSFTKADLVEWKVLYAKDLELVPVDAQGGRADAGRNGHAGSVCGSGA